MDIKKYVKILLEESKKHSLDDDMPNYAYVVGVLEAQLEWALGYQSQRDIVIQNIEEALSEG